MIYTDEEIKRINDAYDEGYEEQLKQWLIGNSIHNDKPKIIICADENGNVIDHQLLECGECCPDFSCCEPKLLWPTLQRALFVQRKDLRSKMLMMALTGLAAERGINIHIAGEESGNA